MIHRLEYILKHNRVMQKLYTKGMSFVFRMIRLFVHTDPHRVLFQSLIGTNYGDSPKILFDRMKSDPAFHGFSYIWAFKDPERFAPEGAEKVRLNSFRYFLETMRAGIWITNVDIERGLHYKKKNTFYLNTWHGVPLKTIGNAQKNRDDYNYFDVDMMCCSSDYEKEIFMRDFHVPASSIVQCGMPRNDALHAPDAVAVSAVKNALHIPEDKRVILYCPTWRDSTDGGQSYPIAPPVDFSHWKEALGEKYVVLFRMHHLTTASSGLVFDEFLRDVSSYTEINDLLMISDILISDYSSVVFDYSILERPTLLFAYDQDIYAKTRGLYKDLNEVLPGNVCHTDTELLQRILHLDPASECEKTRQLKERYMKTEGNATEVCIDRIQQHI